MQRDVTKSAYFALAVAALVLFVGGGARFAIGLTLKPIDAEFAGGRSLVGGAVLAFQVVSAVAMVYAGRLADRHDVRIVLSLGAAIAAAGLGGMALVATPLQLLVLYGGVFALGSGLASLIPVGILVTRTFPAQIGMANAVVLTGMGLGQLVMLAIMAGVVVDSGWRNIYLSLALVHAALLPLIFFGIRKSAAGPRNTPDDAREPKSQQATDGLSFSDGVRTLRFWVLVAVYALCGLEDFFVSTHIVAFAQDHGASAFFAGNLLAAMGLMMLVGVLMSGFASDKLGPVAPTVTAFALRIILFAAVLLDKGPVTVTAFALLFGATFLVTAPLCVVFCRHAFGRRNLGLFTGLITMVHQIAGGLGAWFGAAWFDASGSYDAVLIAMLVSSAAGALLSLMLRSTAGKSR